MNIGFGAKQVIKMAAQNVLLPLWYGLFRLKKIDPRLVIFADAHHDDVPESMELLRDALKETGEFTIREMYMDVQAARPGAVFAFMLRFMRLYAGGGRGGAIASARGGAHGAGHQSAVPGHRDEAADCLGGSGALRFRAVHHV